MAIRFFILWLVVAVIVFLFTYFTPRSIKKARIGWAAKIGVSLAIAAILLAIIMLINNFSGI